jgi:hypothetical protein
MINIGIGIGWAKALYSVANNVIANFKARVLSYPNSIFEAGPCLDATLEELNAIGLLDNASLIITPNAYTEGILYDVIPNTTLGDMTVVRATTATRVNSAGLIEVVPINFLQFSEQFDNAIWTTSSATINANSTTAPNGTLTADKFIATAVSGIHNIVQSTASSSYVFSVYAKAAEETVFSMWIANATKRAEFNLATGTIGLSTVANSSIVNVGNGWYRCSVYDPSATTTYRIYGRTGGVYTGNGIDGMFFWGAQANEGTTAKEYFPTTTRLNIPRIDYTNGSCPSILVEPQRTNVLTYSEALTPNFTFNQCSITSNQISPNGTNNAKRITNGATATDVYFEQSVGIAVNTYTWSACVKKGTDTSATIKPVHVGIGGDVSLMTFTFATETIVTSGVITTSGFTKLSNGWYRIFCTVPITLAVISLRGRFGNSNTPNVYNEWFGVQLEQGNYPTSYIPTTTATVTRNADLISKTGITSLIGQTEGTVFLNLFASAQNSDSVPGFSVLCDIGTGTNRIQIYTNNGYIGFIIYNPGALVIASAFSITPNTNIKVALGYSSGATSMFVNGTQVATTAAALSLSGLDAFTLNKVFGADLSAKNNYNSAILFKTRLTNAELATLTTI